jgi:phage-related protein
VGSSKKDYVTFPEQVQEEFGFELFLAQTGQHPPSAKILKGLGAGVVELIDDFDGDTYRAVYTAHFETVVYVLHLLQEEIEARHSDASKRYRSDQTAISRCRSGLR